MRQCSKHTRLVVGRNPPGNNDDDHDDNHMKCVTYKNTKIPLNCWKLGTVHLRLSSPPFHTMVVQMMMMTMMTMMMTIMMINDDDNDDDQ